MKVEVEDISAVEKRVEIEVPLERVKDEVEEKFDEVKRTAHVKGFRPGKAPRKILERLFKDYIGEMVVKDLVKETLETALDRKGIKPVVDPVIDPAELNPEEPYAYTVHVEVKPEIELKDYKGLEVGHTEQKVSDEDVDKTLGELRENVAIIEEPAELHPLTGNDLAVAEFAVLEDGEVIDFGGEGDKDVALWDRTWIPGLIENLIGKSVGDEVEFEANIGDEPEIPEEFRGRDLFFHVKINGMKERSLAELNDDFAKENTKFETLDELRTSIREHLEQQADQGNRSRLQEALLGKLIEANDIPVPPSLVKNESVHMAQDFMARTVGRRPEQREVEQFAPMFEAEAKKAFQANYLLEAVADAEGIEAEEAEIEEKIGEDAARTGMHPDKFKAQLGENGMEAMKMRTRLDKALDFLVSEATITEEAPGGEAGADSGADTSAE